jgi:hypothetical protein
VLAHGVADQRRSIDLQPSSGLIGSLQQSAIQHHLDRFHAVRV